MNDIDLTPSIEQARCPECGADWSSGLTCEEAFYQMSAWEQSDLERYGSAHHLMVLCFHLQHPSRYSPEGLQGALGLLADFLEGGLSPRQARDRHRAALDSSRRKYKITSRPGHAGQYSTAVKWDMTAVDVVASGLEHFVSNVHAWSRSVAAALKAARQTGQRRES